jgi:hypothetical protein
MLNAKQDDLVKFINIEDKSVIIYGVLIDEGESIYTVNVKYYQDNCKDDIDFSVYKSVWITELSMSKWNRAV